MSDQLDNVSTESENSDGGLLATACNAVTDVVTSSSISTPIKRNAFKAFGQLCSVAIDIPVALFEGIAAENRAETQARIKIISTEADQIAKKMDVDPEFARVAVKKYGQKIVREQVNLDKVSEAAAHQIHQDSIHSESKLNETAEIPPINEDWLNHFEKEVRQKSTEEMQLLFGRILAGEIRRPSSFSIKTVTLMGELDSGAAALFRRLCSLCVFMQAGSMFNAHVLSLGGNAALNSLRSYGLNFDNLNVLHEHGLIIPDYDSYFDYRMCVANKNKQVGLAFSHQNRDYILVPSAERPKDQELLLPGVTLSRSGKELLRIVDIDPSDNYMTALTEYFAQQNLHMVEVTKECGGFRAIY